MTHDITASAFRHLTESDMAEMLRLASSRRYDAGEELIGKGSQDHQVIIIKSGFVRVEQRDGEVPITLARLGPGDVLGEMSFIEGSGATADVRADTEVAADVIAGADLTTLLTSDPGFSARFHRSLALVLSRRLAETSQQLMEVSTFAAASGLARGTPTGQVSERQLPVELVRHTRDLVSCLRGLEERAAASKDGASEDVAGAVSSACDKLVDLLEETAGDGSLLEITFDDLLAFRSTQQVGHGIGGWLFREAYPILMSSATIARVHIRPRGFADDHETLALIHEREPHGDGALGPLVDGWFLDRPVCRSRRNIRAMTARALKRALEVRGADAPAEITGLGTRWPDEVFDLMAAMADWPVTATFVDSDESALVALAERARHRGLFEQVRLVRADGMMVVRGAEQLALAPQAAIWAIGICEYLDNAAIVEMLDWSHDRLEDGGTLLFSNLHWSNPDRLFMDYMLDWPVQHRTEEVIEGLIARSAFAGGRSAIERDETGANMLVSCIKE